MTRPGASAVNGCPGFTLSAGASVSRSGRTAAIPSGSARFGRSIWRHDTGKRKRLSPGGTAGINPFSDIPIENNTVYDISIRHGRPGAVYWLWKREMADRPGPIHRSQADAEKPPACRFAPAVGGGCPRQTGRIGDPGGIRQKYGLEDRFMNMLFDFYNPTRILFGSGKLCELGRQPMPGKTPWC